MAIFRMKIKGRSKPVLVTAESASKAKDLVVTAKSLTLKEVSEALVGGETLWDGKGDLPADEPAPESGNSESESDADADD